MKRKIMRKSISFVFALTMIMASFLTIGNKTRLSASTINSITATGYHHTGQAWDPSGNGVSAFFNGQSIDKLVVDANVGSCVQPWKNVTDLGNYTPTPASNDYLSKLQYHAWTKLSTKSNYDYAVWQLMVWEYFGYTPTSHDVPNYAARKSQIATEIKGHTVLASWNNQTITLNKGESKTIKDSNGVVAGMAQIGSIAGVTITRSGNNITLKNNGGNANGTAVFYKFATTSESGIIYTHPVSQNIGYYPLGDPASSKLNIRTSNGNVKIQKTGNAFSEISETTVDGTTYQSPVFSLQSLADAEFTITADGVIKNHSGKELYADGAIVEVITTDANGIATSNNLPEGNYNIEETRAPIGYNRDTAIYKHSVTAAGGGEQLKTIAAENMKKPQFYSINKTLEKNPVAALQNEEAFKDIEFTIYAADVLYNYNQTLSIDKDTPITTFGIDAEGMMVSRTIDDISGEEVETPFTIDLPYGEYYVKETKTNDSYELDETIYPFTISADTDEEELYIAINDGHEMINKLKEYTVIVNKTNERTGEAIVHNDFEFEAKLYDVNGKVVDTQKVNANTKDGTATFKIKGQVAKVEIKETKAPAGFLLSDEVKIFAIDNESEKALFDENKVYSFTYTNEMIEIVKSGDTSNMYGNMGLLGISGLVMMLIGFLIYKRNETLRFQLAIEEQSEKIVKAYKGAGQQASYQAHTTEKARKGGISAQKIKTGYVNKKVYKNRGEPNQSSTSDYLENKKKE
ncbi:hypothetical protein M2475_001623 [Breznakia sp. PF5-3]|uniref:MSCRAMM family protein n=1 Tax=unclassified Breznakia TaxID=2623764 RepID=UPI0024063A23|nr:MULTISPECIES: prealbumin-like fold domain-containing protein [unclassified Breznakia]MDF9825189.1 hypothetical protein [Breznakia sp. PM6-1]MDF9836047.1 hypothetical protein [Breznakia sp. PF5-3]MDF9838592.1 hypothetical protein [Breznakia sp. PFB2-8]MDF9860639.1 hypothetical protein [Breznakia sp. PH5-24]